MDDAIFRRIEAKVKRKLSPPLPSSQFRRFGRLSLPTTAIPAAALPQPPTRHDGFSCGAGKEFRCLPNVPSGLP
jgi:hypothetical protein